MSNLNEKATRAASRYLEHRGYDILEEGWASPAGTSDIIATEGDTLVFVDVRARRDTDAGFPSEPPTAAERTRREMIALAYLSEHDMAEMAVRFDNIALMVVGDDRALLRHHIGCLSAEADLRASPNPSRRPPRPPGLFEGRALRPSGRGAFLLGRTSRSTARICASPRFA